MSLSSERKALGLTGIGGSEIGAVAGVNPWCRPIDVWRAKIEGREIEETLPMKRGRLLERAVIDWANEDLGRKFVPNPETFKHHSSKLVFSTPDALDPTNTGDLLEVKTANRFTADKWGEPGTDEIPETYLAQVALEMACLNVNSAVVAVLISGDDFRIYNVQRDRELEGRLIESAEKFWTDYVVTRTPPPVDGSESFADYIKSRYPANVAPLADASPEAVRAAHELRAVKAEIKALEEKELIAKNTLKELIGNAEGIRGNGFKVLWKNCKGSLHTDWEAIVRAINPPEQVIQAHTSLTAGSRRFTINFSKGAAT